MLETHPDDGDYVDEWLTTKQAAAFLKRTTHTLAQWRAHNIGPRYARVGNRCVYRRTDLRGYLLEQMTFTADQGPDYRAPVSELTDAELAAAAPREYAWHASADRAG